MEDQEKISLTGKKVFTIKTGNQAYMTWQDRLAEMDRLRRMVYTDMLGIGSPIKKDGAAEADPKNN